MFSSKIEQWSINYDISNKRANIFNALLGRFRDFLGIFFRLNFVLFFHD